MITGAGIFLGIAFLCYSLTNLWLQQRPSDPNLLSAYHQEHYRQIWLVTMSLLVCVVGIMNSMLMSVSERFREIGTMKCLGALDSLIVRLFLIESLFMGIVSSLGGWLFGIIVVTLVRIGTLGVNSGMIGMEAGIFWKIFGCCVGAGALLTIIAALLPSIRASQMQPAVALRSEL
jgi:putative ABC transport system permease protein